MTRRWIFLLPALALCALARPVAAGTLYDLDQRYGRIGFFVSMLNLFDTAGGFGHFSGRLDLDPAHPEKTVIDVDIDTDSADIDWPGGGRILRSTDFFDTAVFSQAHFHSLSVTPGGVDHFYVGGELQLRGVTRPIVLEAMVKQRKVEGGKMAYALDVSGTISRAAFGMVTDRPLVGDEVKLAIHLQLAKARPGE